MKQLDLIISIVALVLAGVVAGVMAGTQRKVQPPPSAPKINVAPIALPDVPVARATSLPGGAATGPTVGRPGGRRAGGSKLAKGG